MFQQNNATGNGANNNDPAHCSTTLNGQNEVGSGGNGGALYSDGNSVNVVLCGDKFTGNAAGANAYGGGIFFTSDDAQGTLSITDTTMDGGTTGGSFNERRVGSHHQGRNRRRHELQEHHEQAELDPAGLPEVASSDRRSDTRGLRWIRFQRVLRRACRRRQSDSSISSVRGYALRTA